MLVALTPVRAQDSRVLPYRADNTLNAYLVRSMLAQEDRRSEALDSALQSVERLQAYAVAAKVRYVKLLGLPLVKTALRPVVTGTLLGDGFKLEKIVYESRPGFHVPANLYIPQSPSRRANAATTPGKSGKYPAVLLFCGHEMSGKATPSYQQTAQLLALNGFIVLAIEPVGQGERIQLLDGQAKSQTRGSTTEHTLLNAGAILTGSSVAAYELWDNVRGLDYLLTRAEVDTARIACIGNSGGGAQVDYFAAFDPRVKAAIPCSYFSLRYRWMELRGPDDGCQHLPFEGRDGLEIPTLYTVFAPKPVLILAGLNDFVDYAGAERAYKELKKVYTVYGRPDDVALFTADDGHGISRPKREAAVQFLRRHFYGDNSPVKEPALALFTEKALHCTATGQVLTNYPGARSIQQINRESAGAGSQHEGFLSERPESYTLRLWNYLYMRPLSLPAAEWVDSTKIILHAGGEPPLPLLWLPAGSSASCSGAASKILLYLNEEGKDKVFADTAVREALRRGETIVAVDLRGMGETRDRADRNDPKFMNDAYRNAIIALHTGRPLLTQRVTDLLNTLGFIRSQVGDGAEINLLVKGATYPVALHAAALAPPVKSIRGEAALRSWRQLLDTPLARNQFIHVLPAALKYYDWPDLVRMLEHSGVRISVVQP